MGKKKKGKGYGSIVLTVVLALMLALPGFAIAEQEWLPGYGDKNGTLGKDGQSWRIGFINTICSEGATSDGFEGCIRAVTLSADRFWAWPDATGTVALIESLGTAMSLTDAKVLIGASTGLAAEQSVSLINDVTGSLVNSGIINATIPASTITSAMILDAAILNSDISTGGVNSTNILDGTIASIDILNGTVASIDILNATIAPIDLTAKGWSIMVAGSATSLGGSLTNTVTNHNINNGNLLFASLASTDDTDFVNTVTNSDHSVLTIVSSADPSTAHSYDYAGISNNPSIGDAPWQIIGAFNSTSAGGDATETVAVAGSLTTDLVIISLEDDGANDVTLAAAAVSSDGTVTITLSADPATSARMSGMVIRPNSTDDTASHTIVFAGSTTTGGGAAAEAITVTGALATDSVIAVQSTFVGQLLEFTSVVANTITATFDADPGADEVISWMILR